ncbi:MAG TPA: hypothetical protein VNK48_06990 [Xanthobacteraceae bacterium]|nr:hypothetical protein [Xanthobacteraceae bacterium]
MSDAMARLSHAAVDLLLTIIETSSMAISGAALDGYHAGAGAELVAVGALEADGFEPMAVSQVDHEDAVVSLAWDGDARRHTYFSPAAGMVAIEDHTLRRLRVRSSWFLDWIARELGFVGAMHSVELVADRLWHLGDVWLGERKAKQQRTAIYVGRRLGEPGAMRRMREALQSRAGRPPGIILTSSPAGIAEDFAGTAMPPILPIIQCAKAGFPQFHLDVSIICTAAHGLRSMRPRSPVQVDAEFRVVRVGDREFRFRGDKQRQVVEYLHRAWEQGEGRVSVAIMFTDLDFPATTRLRDLFRGHRDWKDLIGYEDGACWLRCDELLAGTVKSD